MNSLHCALMRKRLNKLWQFCTENIPQLLTYSNSNPDTVTTTKSHTEAAGWGTGTEAIHSPLSSGERGATRVSWGNRTPRSLVLSHSGSHEALHTSAPAVPSRQWPLQQRRRWPRKSTEARQPWLLWLAPLLLIFIYSVIPGSSSTSPCPWLQI